MSASEVMASEFEAAAERWLTPARGVVDLGKRHAAALLLADWAVTRLAADRAEREERARMIDASRLPVSLGSCRELTKGSRNGVALWHYAGDGTSVVDIPECNTQGALDDLLRVLKGGAE